MAESPAPRRRISWSFIITSIITLGLLVFIMVSIFSRNNRSDTLTYQTYIQALANDRVTEVTITPYEGSLVDISGRYKKYDKNKPDSNAETTFTCQLDWVAWESPISYVPTKDSDDTVIIVIDEGTSTAQLTYSKVTKINTNNPYIQSWWEQWGPTIIMGVVSIGIVVILFFVFSRSVGSSNNKALEFNRSRARRENTSKIKFDDVAGADEEKLEMQEIVSYLKEPKKFSKFGAKLPKGVLLVGPPGCGKTLLAKAVAGEAGVPFYSISGSDFVEMFVGVGAGRVRDMFRIAKENAPCLIFIDEIDAVGRQRGAGLGGGNDEREQTLNQLLVEMDGFSDNAGIIVIAATNRDDVLDPALLRAGRFDRKITVSLPDKKGREAIMKVHARNKNINPEVDFAALAARTTGFSGADLENVLNEAAILAVRNNEENISLADIDEAIDRRISGPAKSSRSITPKEKKTIAYHEAGHAVIGIFLPHSDKVQKITIIPRGNTGGHVLMTPEDDRFVYTKSELEARIVGLLGGRTSEELFIGEISSGAQNDIEVATRIARMMVTELGMSSLGPVQYEKDTGSVFLGRDYTNTQKNFSSQVANEIDKEIRKIIDEAHEKAIALLKEHKEDVEAIAETLLKQETITAEEIKGVLERKNQKVEEKPAEVEPSTEEKDESKEG